VILVSRGCTIHCRITRHFFWFNFDYRLFANDGKGAASSCLICNSAVMNISICNAQLHLTGYVENICCFFRIINAYTLHCRIANSAGRIAYFYLGKSLFYLGKKPFCFSKTTFYFSKTTFYFGKKLFYLSKTTFYFGKKPFCSGKKYFYFSKTLFYSK
jgi:hypothetical protein